MFLNTLEDFACAGEGTLKDVDEVRLLPALEAKRKWEEADNTTTKRGRIEKL